MAAVSFLSRVKVFTATTGTGTMTLGGAFSAFYCTPAEAGAVDGATYRYLIEDGSNFEIGTGVYTASGTTLSRLVVNLSKIGGTAGTTKITLSGNAVVFIICAAEDYIGFVKSPTIQVITSTGTYTAPAGLTYAFVELAGGGGGSGGCATTSAGNGSAGAGGGGGGYASKILSAATIGASQSVTIGDGGTAGAAGANNGGNGGTTSFGAIMSATGGALGQGGAQSTATRPWIAGGVGGVGSGGDVNIAGQGGGWGFVCPTVGSGGFGGSSMLGGGASSTVTGTAIAGTAGPVYGGGASGASCGPSQTQQAGAVGGKGVCIVTEYYN